MKQHFITIGKPAVELVNSDLPFGKLQLGKVQETLNLVRIHVPNKVKSCDKV